MRTRVRELAIKVELPDDDEAKTETWRMGLTPLSHDNAR